MQSENFGDRVIENPRDLAYVINSEFAVSVGLAKGTSLILEIAAKNSDKNEIKNVLEKAKDFVIARHIEKSQFYKEKIMTKQIGEVKIANAPINTPKRKLIVAVAFVTGLILSLFLVFFMEFIKEEIRK